MKLPIDELLPEVLSRLAANKPLLLQSPPGSGKTTRVPVALLDCHWRQGRRILMVQPRRVAARAVATFMAVGRGEPVGEVIGYRTREETRVSRTTVIEVVTDGVFLRLLQADPELADYACILLDEFHERSVLADIGFAMLQDICQTLRDDLRVVVMSATLGELEQYPQLASFSALNSPGRTFPVELLYQPPNNRTDWQAHLVQVVASQMRDHPTDSILVFLPGKPELRRALEQLEQYFPHDILLPLHGDLSLAEQGRVLRALPSGRRVVLSTAIAETSLTLEGIHRVIDAGYGRYPYYDSGTGLSRLVTRRISEASADQRAGRAGRLGPGICIRLWPQSERLARQNTPPILQADLLPVVLAAAQWGARQRTDLPWLDRPPETAWEQARQLLLQWQALDAQGDLTAFGRRLGDIPTEPRVAFMLENCRQHAAEHLPALLAIAAALVTRLATAGSDFLPQVQNAMRHSSGAFSREWQRLLREFGVTTSARFDERQLALLVAQAFPDRIARLRSGSQGRYLLANGKGALLDEREALAGSEWLLVLAMQAERSDGRIYSAIRLSAEDIVEQFSEAIESREIIGWDDREERFIASRARSLGAIVVEQQPLLEISPEAKAHALAELVRREGLSLFSWSPSAHSLCFAIRTLADAGLLDGNWPDFSDKGLLEDCENWLIPFCLTVRRKADFAKIDSRALLWNRLDYTQQQWLKEHLPETFTVPTGRRVTIHYTAEGSAWFEVKLQEMFGLQALPVVGKGAIVLQAHLLSPAGRPVAVTRDIAYFWHNVYPAVRKELRGRYPKHPWPEDPLEAAPQAGVKHPRTSSRNHRT